MKFTHFLCVIALLWSLPNPLAKAAQMHAAALLHGVFHFEAKLNPGSQPFVMWAPLPLDHASQTPIHFKIGALKFA